MRKILLLVALLALAAAPVFAGSFTFTTTTEQDAIIAWELARRAEASKTPPEDAQALLTLEVGHLLRTWQADRKAAALRKVQDAPATVTAEDKVTLGIK